MNTESRLVRAAMASILSGRPESVRFESYGLMNMHTKAFQMEASIGKHLFSGPVRLHSQWSFPFGDSLLTLRGLAAGTDIVLWTVLVRYDEEADSCAS